MGGDDGLPQQYNELMATHRFGYAFYDPESSLVVQPGVCGYIDGTGSWHSIVNVASNAATQKRGYGNIDRDHLFMPPASKRLWGPMLTETVSSSTSSIKAETPLPPGIPAQASAMAEFTLNSQFGAVLLCKGEVTKRWYDHADPFREWAKANAGKLLASFPSIREHGFYVITSTFAAKEVLINGWKNKSHKLHLGFSGGVEEVASISASTEIYGASRASGWVHTICQGKEEKVVFFGGLKYEYRTLTGWMRKDENKFKEIPDMWRGDNNIIQDPEAEDDAVEIDESVLNDQAKF